MGKMLGALTTIVILQFTFFLLAGSCLSEDEIGNCIEYSTTLDFVPGTSLFNLIKDQVSLDGGTCSVTGVNWSTTDVPNQPDCVAATDSEGDPGVWVAGDAFWEWVVGLIGVLGLGAGIVVVGLYITKLDFAFYLGIAGALAVTEGPVYWNAFRTLRNALCDADASGVISCMIPMEILALFMCIFIIPWIIIILDYARGRD